MAMLRVQRFGVAQTAKVIGVMYAALGLLFMPIFLIAAAVAPDGFGLGLGVSLLIPIMYGVIGYVMTAIGCWIYNMLSKYTGGIAVDLEGTPSA
jgi:hypothetical protein